MLEFAARAKPFSWAIPVPESPRSSSMTTICCDGQCKFVALETKAYCCCVDSRSCSTWWGVDCRTAAGVRRLPWRATAISNSRPRQALCATFECCLCQAWHRESVHSPLPISRDGTNGAAGETLNRRASFSNLSVDPAQEFFADACLRTSAGGGRTSPAGPLGTTSRAHPGPRQHLGRRFPSVSNKPSKGDRRGTSLRLAEHKRSSSSGYSGEVGLSA
jgi:hypothetical protein